MRLLTIAGAAALLLMSTAAPTAACEGEFYSAEAASPALSSAEATSTDLSADDKKADDKKPMKKVVKKKPKMKKEKVEYMRAAPMPPGAK